MNDFTSNDNQPVTATPAREPDPHGQAAMLLVESLVHGLIGRSVITVADAVEIIEVACEIKEEVAYETGESRPTMEKSLALLGALHASLSQDLPRD